MKITDIKTDNAIILEILGRIDAGSTETTEKYFNSLISVNDINIIVDCKDLDYINSSGLRIFIMSLKKQAAKGKKLLLCNLQKNIKEVFVFSGFSNLFDVDLDLEAANKLAS
ncbi:MAG: hypothetical protein B6I20_03060 [Bacteroidetes bacterium 4572_117]|nr:MAG: hypothetical protein B6I20_03060 [Bacteroidetes bacterium 4572_117]